MRERGELFWRIGGGRDMANKPPMNEWQNAVIEECTRRLQRKPTEVEEGYIASHVGFMALEAIEDAVKTLNVDALQALLNSKATE